MKKLLTVIFICGILIALGVSCNSDITSSEVGTKDVAKVYVGNSRTKALTGSSVINPDIEAANLYWMYTAEKTDGSVHRTGEQLTAVPVKKDGSGNPTTGLEGLLGAFSTGGWKFSFWGYKDAPESSGTGYTPIGDAVFKREDVTAEVTQDTYLTIELVQGPGAPDAEIVLEDITYSYALLENTDKISAFVYDGETPIAYSLNKTTTGTDIIFDGDEWKIGTLSEGSHTLTFKAYHSLTGVDATSATNFASTTGWETVAESSITITVKKGVKITITGSIDDLDPQYDVYIDNITYDTANETFSGSTEIQSVEMNAEQNVIVDITPAYGNKTGETNYKTIIKFPGGSFGSETTKVTENINVVVYQTPVAAAKFQVTSGSDTESAVAGLDLSVTVDNVPVTTFNDKVVIVSTYIAKSLTNVSIHYGTETWDSTDISSAMLINKLS